MLVQGSSTPSRQSATNSRGFTGQFLIGRHPGRHEHSTPFKCRLKD